jgi:subtilisin family serine protease
VGAATPGGAQNLGGGSNSGNTGNQAPRRPGSGVPPSSERNYVPDEVVIELAADTTDQAAQALAQRFNLQRLESFDFQLAGTKIHRWRISDRRSVPTVVRALETSGSVISVSPNYIMRLHGEHTVAVGAPALEQYALTKLQVPQAHTLARGERVLIAIIDGGVDTAHPELAGSIADTFDAIGSGDNLHAHGTAIAGAIAAQARLKGTAPAAQILAARAFGARKDTSEGTSFHVVKAIDWAVARGARIINMSFAGPRDPKIELSLKAARLRGVILVAAAGNAGPRSRPLYPAADPNVIAVTATDEEDQLFSAANRGTHIAVAAPGVELWLPGLNGTYQETSGTSFAAAEVSGTVALMIERKPSLTHDEVRRALMSTARDLGPRGIDPQFGAGLVDAYRAVLSVASSVDASAGSTGQARH